MIVKAVKNTPGIPVTETGTHGATIRRLLDTADGTPNLPCAASSSNPEEPHQGTRAREHETCIPPGTCTIFCKGKTCAVTVAPAVSVEPDAIHRFINNAGEDLLFLCMTPLS